MSAILKSRASSLNKIKQLPKYRHPADMVNQQVKPMELQNKLINGQLQFGKNLYGNDAYESLMKSVSSIRKNYRSASNIKDKQQLAKQQYGSWNSYLQIKHSLLPEQFRLNPTQKQRIYESLIVTKQRNEQRLALNRFISFFNEYSRGYKFDIQLSPLVMMRLTYPHWGYLNLFPSASPYRLNIEEVFSFLEEATVASIERQQGNSLHSSQLLSFIFWKLYTRKFPQQSPLISKSQFCTMLGFFKFNNINEENFNKQFQYSIQKGQLQNSGDKIRFDLWRRIFLDRDL